MQRRRTASTDAEPTSNSALAATLTARFNNVFPLAPRSFASRGSRRNNAASTATAPTSKARNASRKGSDAAALASAASRFTRRVPFANLFQSGRTCRPASPHEPVNPLRDPRHVGHKQPRMQCLRGSFRIGLQFGPTGKPLLPCDHILRIVHGHFLPHRGILHVDSAEMLSAQPRERVRASGPHRPQEFREPVSFVIPDSRQPPSCAWSA